MFMQCDDVMLMGGRCALKTKKKELNTGAVVDRENGVFTFSHLFHMDRMM